MCVFTIMKNDRAKKVNAAKNFKCDERSNLNSQLHHPTLMLSSTIFSCSSLSSRSSFIRSSDGAKNVWIPNGRKYSCKSLGHRQQQFHSVCRWACLHSMNHFISLIPGMYEGKVVKINCQQSRSEKPIASINPREYGDTNCQENQSVFMAVSKM